MKKYVVAIVIGFLGGLIFSLLHMPLPWTLGPLMSVAVAKIIFKQQIYWSGQIRNFAMVVLGYSMGRAFTPETVQRIMSILPILLAVSFLSMTLFLIAGYITSRYTGLSLPTSLFGNLPAGLSQSATVCEEIEGADVAAITLMQTIRVLVVVFTVPFLALHGLSDGLDIISPSATKDISLLKVDEIITLAGLFSIISILVYLSKYLKIPGRFIITPILGTAAFVLSGISAPQLPVSIINLAQLFVGIRIGTGINITTLANWRKISFYSLVNIVVILIVLFALDYGVSLVTSISFVTAFIGTAPGGMAEMGLTAMMVHADIPTVIAFQLFRLLFVLIIVIPILNWYFKRSDKHKHKKMVPNSN